MGEGGEGRRAALLRAWCRSRAAARAQAEADLVRMAAESAVPAAFDGWGVPEPEGSFGSEDAGEDAAEQDAAERRMAAFEARHGEDEARGWDAGAGSAAPWGAYDGARMAPGAVETRMEERWEGEGGGGGDGAWGVGDYAGVDDAGAD